MKPEYKKEILKIEETIKNLKYKIYENQENIKAIYKKIGSEMFFPIGTKVEYKKRGMDILLDGKIDKYYRNFYFFDEEHETKEYIDIDIRREGMGRDEIETVRRDESLIIEGKEYTIDMIREILGGFYKL